MGPGLGPSSSSPSSSYSFPFTPSSHPTQDHRGRLELRAGYTLHAPLPPLPFFLSGHRPSLLPLPSIHNNNPPLLSLPSFLFLHQTPSHLLRPPAAVTALYNQLMWSLLTLTWIYPRPSYYALHSTPSLTFHYICVDHIHYGMWREKNHMCFKGCVCFNHIVTEVF